MSLIRRRIRAIVRKELRDYRRNRSIVAAMAVFPLIFLIQPLIADLQAAASDAAAARSPARAALHARDPGARARRARPPTRSSASASRARSSRCSRTPIRREELLLGKALAALIPAVAIAYAVFAIFLALRRAVCPSGRRVGAHPRSGLLAQLLFTPLLAAWSIWIAIAISTRRATPRRAAAQHARELPLAVVTSLIAFDVIHASLGLAVVAVRRCCSPTARLGGSCRALFDRERLITAGDEMTRSG